MDQVGPIIAAELERVKKQRDRWRIRANELEKSRALWKARAQAKHGSFGRSTGRANRRDRVAA